MTPDLSNTQWYKSTHSSGGNDCVEIAHLGDGLVGVRDSKNPTSGTLTFAPTEWDAFLSGAQIGKFNQP